MKFSASEQYNRFDGCLWMTPEDESPSPAVIKIEADEEEARAIAAKIEKIDF